MDEAFKFLSDAIKLGSKPGAVLLLVGVSVLLVHGWIDPGGTLPWLRPASVVVAILGGALLLVAITERTLIGLRSVIGKRNENRAGAERKKTLDREIVANLGITDGDERQCLRFLFASGMQRFTVDNFNAQIESLLEKRLIAPPTGASPGQTSIWVVADAVWDRRDDLLTAWAYVPHAKPMGLMTRHERAAAKRI